MKTVYASEAATIYDTVQAFAQANVGVVFIAAIVLTALFASWASKHI